MAGASEKNGPAESEALSVGPNNPVAVLEDIPTAPVSPVSVDPPKISLGHNTQKLHERRASSGSVSDFGDQDKSLKRKLADRGTSHGPENGDATRAAADENDASKRARDEDDNPRAKKRPTPPRTPEAENASERRPTPPATPPSECNAISKAAEHLQRPRDDVDKDDNSQQTRQPSPPPEKTLLKDEPATITPKLVRIYNFVVKIASYFSVIRAVSWHMLRHLRRLLL